MPYAYTARDLLADSPFHYMYSPFEGEQFLRDYFASRHEARQQLVSVTFRLATPAGHLSQLPLLGATDIRTIHVLDHLVAMVRTGDEPQEARAKAWINMFARKFEVSKRLRQCYDRDLRPIERQSVGREAYAQLAFLIATTIAGSEELRLLNTLLKLNDLVLSGPIADDQTKALMRIAVDRELECVGTIAARSGIKMPEVVEC